MPRVKREESEDLDRRIASSLKGQDRISLSDVAKSVGLSPSTVHERVVAMHGRGVILGYTAVLEKEKLGYGAGALLMLNVSSELDVEEIGRQLASIPDIEDVYEVGGEPDLVATVWATTLEDLRSFINEKISKIPGVEDVTPLMLMRVYKKSGFTMPARKV